MQTLVLFDTVESFLAEAEARLGLATGPQRSNGDGASDASSSSGNSSGGSASNGASAGAGSAGAAAGGGAAARRAELIARGTLEQLGYLAQLYSPYTFYRCRFGTANTQALYGALTDAERSIFDFDLTAIEWRHYIASVHIPGLRKYVLKGRST